MDRQPHVIVVPFPAQGHVAPLMKLALQIAAHGVIKLTFVNTEFIQAQITASISPDQNMNGGIVRQIRMVSVPDGLEQEDDRKDSFKFTKSISRVMPGNLTKLIEDINQSNPDEQITCVIADTAAWWALEVAKNMGIQRVAVWPAGPASLALTLQVPNLIETGIIDNYGTPMKDESVWLSNEIPSWSSNEMAWSCSDPKEQKRVFEFICKTIQVVKFSSCLLCNSFYELDSPTYNWIPNILPIGPLLASNHSVPFAGNFWPEDSTCLTWLDKQPAGSVIYVAFGSTAIFSLEQFDELAHGLEFSGRPFLWAVRSNSIDRSSAKFSEGFANRVINRGKIVEWAPQEKVLAHPSVACFLSHCGWNSTMEGLTMGVPFLCWPYFADQFHNKNYICDVWKIGLGFNPDENGIITRHEIQAKIERLLADNGIKANTVMVKDMAEKSASQGGSSFRNFQSFIEQMKH